MPICVICVLFLSLREVRSSESGVLGEIRTEAQNDNSKTFSPERGSHQSQDKLRVLEDFCRGVLATFLGLPNLSHSSLLASWNSPSDVSTTTGVDKVTASFIKLATFTGDKISCCAMT